MAITTETVPFDFESLYEGLKDKFEEKGYDIAEGSNTSQLITAMAYLTSMLNMNTAVNINETLLPLATKRDNALQDARVLGYETAHTQSYRYRLTLDLAAGNHTIPKYSKFEADGHEYFYMGSQIDLKDITDGYQIQLDVKEGHLHRFTDNPDTLIVTTGTIVDDDGNSSPQYYIDVPFVNVEEDGLEVFLTYYDEFGNLYTKEEWSKSKKFMIDKDTTLKKEYIRLDNIDFKTPRIYFTLSGVGEGVRVGTIVEMNALVSNGTKGGIENFTEMTTEEKASAFSHSLTGATIIDAEIILQGTDEESIPSIKANAPMFYNSANRAVTKNDYLSICNRHQSIDTSMIWGGDDEFPRSPGHIWFSFTPNTRSRTFSNNEFKTEFTLDYPLNLTNWFVENSEIRSFEYTADGQLISPGAWDVLDDYKIPTLEFHNRHPIYLDFDYNFQILKYNIKTSKADIHQELFDIVDGVFTGVGDTLHLENFEQEYFHSSLRKRIDQNLTDITGFNDTVDTRLLITKKNVSQENVVPTFRDVFIPLAVPFESYFNNAGELISSVLPSIDTTNFAQDVNGDDVSIYTDWSGVTGDVQEQDVITAPVMADINGTVTTCGVYYLFNSYKKYVLVQLFVDAAGYNDDGTYAQPEYTEPKSYLTTTEGFYIFTNDKYYVTAEGYAVISQTEVNAITGPIAREVDPLQYTNSVITMGMFENPVYLNLDYASANFKVFKNIIPRLHSVTFE